MLNTINFKKSMRYNPFAYLDREALKGAAGAVPARQDAPHEEGPILRLEGVVQVGEANVSQEHRWC